ncbi:hypothetical protein [Agrobacterium fabrum]|uniref:hypothetical protein n=1 Tax=Agrobacterium fabrum TaxID=1176649 RepID=UPI003BA1CFD2
MKGLLLISIGPPLDAAIFAGSGGVSLLVPFKLWMANGILKGPSGAVFAGATHSIKQRGKL